MPREPIKVTTTDDPLKPLSSHAATPTQTMGEHVTDVHGCARCEGDHRGVVFMPLRNPTGAGDTHWSACPNLGEPILLRFFNPEDYDIHVNDKVVQPIVTVQGDQWRSTEDFVLNGFNYGKKKADGQFERYPTDGLTGQPFVRPVRDSYVHVGVPGSTHQNHVDRQCGRDAPPGSGCGAVTRMGSAIAEQYARNPKFYGATMCVRCKDHFPVGEHGEFVWDGTEERVGT